MSRYSPKEIERIKRIAAKMTIANPAKGSFAEATGSALKWKPYLEERGGNGKVYCTRCNHWNSPGLGGWSPAEGDDCMYCNGEVPNCDYQTPV